jgi:predicted dehydrogenase
MNRRVFLMASSGAALAASPSNRIVAGLIGSGGRGRTIMGRFRRHDDITVAGVGDVYEPNLEKGLSAAGPGVKAYRNYKQLLENQDINVVIIATPEHWHHRMLLDAIAAGKDVYIEKPLCHTPEEGAEMVRAVKNSDRIVQVGMQRRSYGLYQEGRDLRRRGRLGTVRMVRTYWLNNGLRRRDRSFEGPIDWEQWQGPAKRRIPKDPKAFFNWRHLSDYSGGVVMDQGAHIYDSIHMIMDAGYPTAVTASACKGHVPGLDRPETVVVSAEYPEDFLAVFTINYAAMRYPGKEDQLNAYDGDLARMDLGREFLRVFFMESPEIAGIQKGEAGGFSQATTEHVNNFIACVRSRQTPSAPIDVGFQAALILQLGNLSLEHGKRVVWNADEMKAEV